MGFGVGFIEFDIAGFDGELPALGHRVSGVHGEIHDHLLDLARVHFHRTGALAEDGGKLHILANQAAQHLLEIGKDDIDVQDFRFQNLLAAEGQKLAG